MNIKDITKKRDNPNIVTKEEWCRQCGLCCHHKTQYGEEAIVYLNTQCEWLDKQNKCKIYQQRNLKDNFCVQAKTALLLCMLPKTCPYVEKNWQYIKEWYIEPIISKTIYKKHRNK